MKMLWTITKTSDVTEHLLRSFQALQLSFIGTILKTITSQNNAGNGNIVISMKLKLREVKYPV